MALACTPILLLLHLSAGPKEVVTCNGEDEGSWTVVGGGDHTDEVQSPSSEHQCTAYRAGTQDNIQTLRGETVNGTVAKGQ